MAKLTHSQKLLLEKLFRMGDGYVLDFTNTSFQRFVASSVGLDIYDQKYAAIGDSKAKRLRYLFEVEPDPVVGKLIKDTLEHITVTASLGDAEMKTIALNKPLFDRCTDISSSLLGGSSVQVDPENEIDNFLKNKVGEIPLAALSLDVSIIQILEERIREIKKCLHSDAALSVIFLCGSTLEGILLGLATQRPKDLNQAPSAPKNKETNKTRPFQEWTLQNFIETAHELGFLGLDIKKHGHSLRDFRNFIHPNEQLRCGFYPDHHTATISWHVLNAAIHDIKKKLESVGHNPNGD